MDIPRLANTDTRREKTRATHKAIVASDYNEVRKTEGGIWDERQIQRFQQGQARRGAERREGRNETEVWQCGRMRWYHRFSDNDIKKQTAIPKKVACMRIPHLKSQTNKRPVQYTCTL